MLKKEIRKKYLANRKQLTSREVNELSEKIFGNFLSKFKLSENQKVHIFLSIAKFREVNTYPFIKYFSKNGIRMFIPKVYNDALIAVEFTGDIEMEVSDWGIAEPKSHVDVGIRDYDIIITPLLYCDENGNRVGFGKGYYDGFFSTINPECLKVGLGFFEPHEKIEDVSARDIPLDYLVTPDRILSFGGAL